MGERSRAALQVVVTVQVASTAIAAHAASVWVAPLLSVSVSALHTQIGGVPMNAPVASQVHVDVAAGLTADPAAHAVVTVQVPVTATLLAPHAVVVWVAPLPFISTSAMEQRQKGAVPDQVFPTRHVHVEVEADGSRLASHVVPTVQVDATLIVAAPHADVSCVAPFVPGRFSAVLQRHTGAVPVHVPVVVQVHVLLAPGFTVRVPEHAVVTVHVVVAGMLLAPHAVVVCVAPLTLVSDSAAVHLQENVGGVSVPS